VCMYVSVMYVCVIYVCMFYMWIYVDMYVNSCMDAYQFMWYNVPAHQLHHSNACKNVCLDVCVCVSVCVHVDICGHVCECMHGCISIYVAKRPRSLTAPFECMQEREREREYVCVYAYIRVYVRMCMIYM
jgi:hypothetical protein